MVEENDNASEASEEQKNELFLRLLMTNQKEIYAFVLSLYPDPAGADDILQETATVLWKKFDEFQLGTNFKAWAIKVAHNIVLNYWRKRSNCPVKFSSEMVNILSEQLAKTEDRSDDRIQVLKQCLSKLKKDDLRLINMRYFQNMTIRSLADHLNRPLAGLYKTMSRTHYFLLECISRTQRLDEKI